VCINCVKEDPESKPISVQVTEFSNAVSGLPAAPPGVSAASVAALGASLAAMLPLEAKSTTCRATAGNLTVLQALQGSPIFGDTIGDITTYALRVLHVPVILFLVEA